MVVLEHFEVKFTSDEKQKLRTELNTLYDAGGRFIDPELVEGQNILTIYDEMQNKIVGELVGESALLLSYVLRKGDFRTRMMQSFSVENIINQYLKE